MRPDRTSRFVLNGGILATACIAIGSLWDAPVHIRSGHTLFAPAHLFIVASAVLFTAAGVAAFFRSRRAADTKLRMYLKPVVFGSFLLSVALVVIDEAWHLLFGPDQTGWSPPHLLYWAGALIELGGLLMLERFVSQREDGVPRSFRLRQVLISAAILVIILFLFLFLEADVPQSAHIAKWIPGFSYPVLGTLLFTAGLFFIVHVVGYAWMFFASTGIVLEYVTNFSFIVPPFPVVFPALVLDGWIYIVRKKALLYYLGERMVASFVVSSACFWGMVAWAAFVTKLPQQLGGTPLDWLVWFFIFVPVCSVASCLFAWYAAGRIARIEKRVSVSYSA